MKHRALPFRGIAKWATTGVWISVCLFITGHAYATDEVVSVTGPNEIIAGELGIIDFPVSVSGSGTVTDFSVDLNSLPPGNTATFTPDVGNTSGIFHWSPEAGSAGNYTVTFVAVIDGVSHMLLTALSISPIGTAELARGTFEWHPWGYFSGSYEVSFYATDQGGTSTLTVPVSVINYGGCPDAPRLERSTARLAPSRGTRLRPTLVHSAPIMSWWGNTEGVVGMVNCVVAWDDPIILDVQAYSMIPESNLDLGCTSTYAPFGITSYVRAPQISAPQSTLGVITEPMVIDVRASDPDGDPIASLTADLSSLPSGNNAEFTESPDHLSGTLTWTPSAADSGNYLVPFRAANLFATTASTLVQVRGPDVTGVPDGTRKGAALSAFVWPNPVSAESKLQLVTTRSGSVRIRLFDVRGRLLGDLLPVTSVDPGMHELPIRMDAIVVQLRSGVYFYRVETAEGILGGRLTVLR